MTPPTEEPPQRAFDDVELIGDTPSRGEEVAAELNAAPNPRSLFSMAARAELAAVLGEPGRDELRFDEPLGRHCTLKLGGLADALVAPTSVERLQAVLRWCASLQVPLTVIGAGSNLLIRDGGLRGVVLSSENLRGLSLTPPARIVVEAGVSTGKVLAFALAHELGGVEFLGGVPGSVGGGLIMNAGTYLGEFKDVTAAVSSVRLIDGELVRRDGAACGFRYRASDLPRGEMVLSAELALRSRPRAEIEDEVRALRRRRAEREPKKVSSAGSTFKNPAGDFAGRLIETAGCKGWQVGAAQCSPVHANWLVNTGGASAAELLELIERVRERVREVHGVELELEVKVLGEP
ncbi:MAG: UDP-N-acetylmuramate dehydrogenase [Kofleriaceae bacterium]